MKIIETNEGSCTQYLERCDDGGLIISTLVPTGTGEYISHRHWYQDPDMAREVYTKEEDVDKRVRDAKQLNVTGKLVDRL